ncbi:hypothetical protein SCLCIDRAFT_1212168 [Scleroderma citrinum Foug A]|uniref:ATPase inhibitor, mitochondrial n=1 Tax=Scleroderma citrinum Foug A TaxID=1036808 RepID=A0A0C3AKE8_9AGAM|nr:hypothetical protein SCLCIDRAFT_1212168 [Scleroderma citrinum Foug A]
MLARVSRTLYARRMPFTMRTYTVGRSEGSVAESRQFGKKEKAHEDEYARRHDAELLRKMKAELEAKKKQVAELEAKVEGKEKAN